MDDCTKALRLTPKDESASYNLACIHFLQMKIEPCIANLARAIELDVANRKLGQTDPDLEWARQDERVKKLLGME